MIDTFASISTIAGALLKLLLLLLVVAAVPLLWEFWRAARKLRGLNDRMQGDLAPLIRHATSIADNVNDITTTIRTDIAHIHATVAEGNERVRDAIALTEQRLHDFSALLEVVQDEAEALFVSSAAAVRGVRSGAAALGKRGGPEFAVDDLDGSDDEDAGETEDPDDLEMGDGYDRSTERTENGPAYPRVRPRARRRG